MFGWLRSNPTCPVKVDDKIWIEKRFAWLVQELGVDRLKHGTLILPTTEFFPASYHATEDELVDLMNRVAEYMDVDPESLSLNFYQEVRPPYTEGKSSGTAGLYNKGEDHFEIWLEASTLIDPLGVVATLAHEIGHVILLGEQRVAQEEDDHEPLTDLLTVYLGLGIVTANSVLRETSWSDGQMSGWSHSRRGYLTMDMYGYALALYALSRGERSPDWLHHLRPDVRRACRNGLRYILENGDCSHWLPAIHDRD